jgi:hypothetical protein
MECTITKQHIFDFCKNHFDEAEYNNYMTSYTESFGLSPLAWPALIRYEDKLTMLLNFMFLESAFNLSEQIVEEASFFIKLKVMSKFIKERNLSDNLSLLDDTDEFSVWTFGTPNHPFEKYMLSREEQSVLS